MVRGLLLAALAAAVAAAPAHDFAPSCANLLGGVAASGHNDVEVAAFCRAAYTPEMCGSMRASLGPMPWPATKIQATCQHWNSRIEAGKDDRDLLSYEEFQKTLEDSADEKKKLGYKMPKHQDGTVDLEKTVQMKSQQSEVIINAYYNYMGWTTTPEPKPAWRSRLHDAGKLLGGKWLAGDGFVAALPQVSAAAAACGAAALLAAAAGAAVGVKRFARRARQREALVTQAGQEFQE